MVRRLAMLAPLAVGHDGGHERTGPAPRSPRLERARDRGIRPTALDSRHQAAAAARDGAGETWIRHLHPHGFRYGQWARLTMEAEYRGRPCYWVTFEDGLMDYWDPRNRYEFFPAKPAPPRTGTSDEPGTPARS